MKRSWNGQLWWGFILVVIGVLSYIPIFTRFPITRNFPWVNLLLLACGLALLAAGLVRAFRRPEVYRGRVFGTVLMVLAAAGSGLFCWGTIYLAHQLPPSTSAPRVGQKAPDFVLPDQDGKPVALADLVSSPSTQPASSAKAGGALLIFYRGYW